MQFTFTTAFENYDFNWSSNILSGVLRCTYRWNSNLLRGSLGKSGDKYTKELLSPLYMWFHSRAISVSSRTFSHGKDENMTTNVLTHSFPMHPFSTPWKHHVFMG